MTILGIAVIFGVVLCALALQANARFRQQDRLPMQWWLTGQVTWSAPRILALAFIPALAILILAAYVILALNVAPRTGQEHLVLPTLIGLGVTFVAIQLLHVWLIARTLRPGGN